MISAAFLLTSVLQLPISDERTAQSFFNRSPNVASEEDVTTVKAELWIDEKGKTRSCMLLQFEGSSDIANKMCRRAVGTIFKSAKDHNGEPVNGLLVTASSVYPQGYRYLADLQSKALNNELQTVKISLDLGKVGSPSTVPPFLNLLVLIDEQGKQAHCDPGEVSGAEIAELACEQSVQFTYEIRTSGKGDPVPYVRMVTVEFLQEPSQ